MIAATTNEPIVIDARPRYWNIEYAITSNKPIPPAMSPAQSWLVPRVAEMLFCDFTSNEIGNEPYFSESASAFALS